MKTQILFGKTTTAALAVMGSAALASAGVVGPALAMEQGDAPSVQAEADAGAQTRTLVSEHAVQGNFGYTQNALSENATISSVFCKSVFSLCAAMPDYTMAQCVHAITVQGGTAGDLEATVQDMAQQSEMQSVISGCACSSNLPGGGAIVNAEVSGVTLASIATTAGAWQ